MGLDYSKSSGGSSSNGNSIGMSIGAGSGGSVGNSRVETATSMMVMNMLESDRPYSKQVRHITDTTVGKMDLQTAIARLDGKLPADISSLVRVSSKSNTKGFAEESLQKARRIL